MVNANVGLGVSVGYCEQIAPTPKIVALALDETSGCLARLVPKLPLLVADPASLGALARVRRFS
jgi:hypothetical protein